MSMVKVLYVRNLSNDLSDEFLKQRIEEFGKMERVKQMKNYAFLYFEERNCAIAVMNAPNYHYRWKSDRDIVVEAVGWRKKEKI